MKATMIEYQMIFNLHKKNVNLIYMMQHLIPIVRLMKFSIFKNNFSGINWITCLCVCKCKLREGEKMIMYLKYVGLFVLNLFVIYVVLVESLSSIIMMCKELIFLSLNQSKYFF